MCLTTSKHITVPLSTILSRLHPRARYASADDRKTNLLPDEISPLQYKHKSYTAIEGRKAITIINKIYLKLCSIEWIVTRSPTVRTINDLSSSHYENDDPLYF